MRRSFLLAAVLLCLCGCADTGAGLPPWPVHPNGQALWHIIHDQCVPDQRQHGSPSPCVLVSLNNGEAHGYAVLKDRTGVAQHLLMPTAKITGIEDPLILAAGATNYFAKAWDERHLVQDRLGRPVGRTQLSVAVNSVYGRTQDQLHLHIDCVDASVATALRGLQVSSAAWSARPILLKGRRYRVRWLADDQLAATHPFELLAETMPGARQDMAAWTLALVGGVDPQGQPGFYLLADRADPAKGDPGSAEALQDHSCALQAGGPPAS